MYVDQKHQKNNLSRWGIELKVINNRNLSIFIQQVFYNEILRFSHMQKKKEIRFSRLFSRKPLKNYMLPKNFKKVFAHLLKKPKVVFASPKNF